METLNELRPDIIAPREATHVSERTRLGLGVLGAALALGLLGDGLLRATPWGINVLLWTAALLIAIAILVRWRRLALAGKGLWLLAPALFFAAALAWRDSSVLKGLDVLMLFITLSLLMLRARSGRVILASTLEYIQGMIFTLVSTLLSAPALFRTDIQWKEIPRHPWSRQAPAIGRGLLIAFPLLIVFGGLFAAADSVFGDLADRLFSTLTENLLRHLFLTFLIGWLTCGFLRGTLLANELTLHSRERPRFLYLGIIEIGIVLGLLDLLFLAFVIIQFRYFFGGAATVVETTGLTYAEYARRGFFELVTVASLALPLLLLAHWLLRKESPNHERIYRALAGVMLVMLAVIMISAVQRMRLYQSEYGLTELRLYTTAFMAWLAIVFLWFASTVLCGKRERFVFGALVAAWLVIGYLHLLNPDALIVRTNIGRLSAGRSFDAKYVTSLSADAIPSLTAALPNLSQKDRCLIATRLLKRWPPSAPVDWRSWSWARATAQQALPSEWLKVQALSCQPEK